MNRLSQKVFNKSISIYLIGSTYRNNDLELTKEWFRPNNYPALTTLLEETENAKKLNQILSKKIKDSLLTNVIFIDPLEIIDQSCGKDIKSYLTCFRDSDHLSDKSSNELMEFLFKNYLRSLKTK